MLPVAAAIPPAARCWMSFTPAARSIPTRISKAVALPGSTRREWSAVRLTRLCASSSDILSGQQQMEVAEFVPEIVTVQSGLVGALQVTAPGDGLKHGQVRASRLVQAGEQTVNDPYTALSRDDYVCPAAARYDSALPVRHGLQSPNHGRANGVYSAAGGSGGIDGRSRGGRD